MSVSEGYVYVISNKSMPDFIKVGFTTRDPERRAVELSGTALPFPSVVEFSVLVPNAAAVERETHRRLQTLRVTRDREWFACSRERAIEAIRESAGKLIKAEKDRAIEEERKRVARERARQEAESRRRSEQIAEERRHAKERSKQDIRRKYEPQLAALTTVPHFILFWIAGAFGAACFFTIFLFNGREPTSNGFTFICIIVGAVVGFFLQEFVREQKKKTKRYLALEAKRDAEITMIEQRFR